jgi:hypothetical protein
MRPSAGIIEQSMGARNRIGTGLSRAHIMNLHVYTFSTLRKRKRRHRFGAFNAEENHLKKQRKKGKKFHVWKCWMFPLKGWRLL